MKRFALLLTLLPFCGYTQIHNRSAVFIPQEVTVHTHEVNNSGFIMNNGIMSVSGNWTNANIYQGTGAIVLSGETQVIRNNDQSINKLVIDGGGDKIIKSKLVVNAELALLNGIVQFEDNGLLSLDPAAGIQGGSTASFINGPLSWSGTGFRFFPVGTNRQYFPVWLSDVSGLDLVIAVEAHGEANKLRTGVDVENINPVYWTIKTIDGQFQGSHVNAAVQSIPADRSRLVFLAGTNVEEDLAVVANDGIFPEGDLDVVRSKEIIAQSIFTVATLPEEPVRPSYLSTTLSPNAANAVNRVIKMQGPDLISDGFLLEVYSRWGNRLFETSSLEYMVSTGWEGNHNGQPIASGAYPFRLIYHDRTGKETQQTGFITVVY
jgi:hypothetical protein